ncbi:Uncharacterised protein [Vibrio cholerae]|nr:Uncharacterised protein [Vibrio cholerae]
MRIFNRKRKGAQFEPLTILKPLRSWLVLATR